MVIRPSITDQDVQILAAIATALHSDYDTEEAEWEGSPFAWIKTRPSRQVGKIGEQLVAGWCAAKGLDVVGPSNSEHDRVIHGYRIEVKFSTLWKQGRYVFQQIRDQSYDFVICLGVAPFDAHSWVIPKTLLLERVIGHMGQHTGRSGADTAWLHVDPHKPDSWLAACGGSLGSAYAKLIALPHGPHGAN